MTDSFIPDDQPIGDAPDYPVVFGISITPLVGGLLLGALGLLGTAFLVLNLVQPEFDKNQQLTATVAGKEGQLGELATIKAKIKKAETDLAAAKTQQQEVLSLFASEASLDTLLLDINRQIDARTGEVAQQRTAKLATCPVWVRQNVNQLEEKVGELVTRPQLRKFTPNTANSGVISDSSYGALINGKLKRQVADVEIVGNFNQTQSILRSIERLQPLLVLRETNFKLADQKQLYEVRGDQIQFLSNCQPDTKIATTFKLEALLPLSETEKKAAAPPAPPK